ncbi:hypothetical protein LINPERPRIM_LOCUS12138 [Linum perenne]
MASNPSLKPEIGPDGLARESPVIAYTERVRILHSGDYGSIISNEALIIWHLCFLVLFDSGDCRRAAPVAQVS